MKSKIKLLIEYYDCTLENAIVYAAYDNDFELVKYLLDKGCDMDTQDEFGNTALTEASYISSLEMVKCLVEKGANLDIKNNRGVTAYKCANNEIKEYLDEIKNKRTNRNI